MIILEKSEMGLAKGTQGTLKTMVMPIFFKPGVRCIVALQIQHTTLEVSFIYLRFDFKNTFQWLLEKFLGSLLWPSVPIKTSPPPGFQPSFSTLLLSSNIPYVSHIQHFSFLYTYNDIHFV